MITIILYLCSSLTPADINAEIYKHHRENPRARVMAVVSDCEEK